MMSKDSGLICEIFYKEYRNAFVKLDDNNDDNNMKPEQRGTFRRRHFEIQFLEKKSFRFKYHQNLFLQFQLTMS